MEDVFGSVGAAATHMLEQVQIVTGAVKEAAKLFRSDEPLGPENITTALEFTEDLMVIRNT